VSAKGRIGVFKEGEGIRKWSIGVMGKGVLLAKPERTLESFHHPYALLLCSISQITDYRSRLTSTGTLLLALGKGLRTSFKSRDALSGAKTQQRQPAVQGMTAYDRRCKY
jgi:hypothetical protein